MRSLGRDEPSAAAVARHYSQAWPDVVDVLVIDTTDENQSARIAESGIRAHVTGTLIGAAKERRRLAQEILELAGAL
jgi:2-phospho-L-lactate transferase/gluconeogenesis factor (CofD/UPF0052 family)